MLPPLRNIFKYSIWKFVKHKIEMIKNVIIYIINQDIINFLIEIKSIINLLTKILLLFHIL